MNERGQYGSRPLRIEDSQCGHVRGQYAPFRASASSASSDRGRAITPLALHVMGILLIGLGLAYLLIRWSGA